eukprot:g22775.t1
MWIRNVSSRQFSGTEKAVLLCRLNYKHKDTNGTCFMAVLETTLKDNRFTDETQQAIPQTIIPTLSRRNKWDTQNTSERKALHTLKKDRNVKILPADKGNMTVIKNKPDYVEKAQALLADTNTYQQVVIDPTLQL